MRRLIGGHLVQIQHAMPDSVAAPALHRAVAPLWRLSEQLIELSFGDKDDAAPD
jgi:hypothetical protein